VLTPLVKSLRPGGRLIGIHSHGKDPGIEIIDQVWPGDDLQDRPLRHPAPGQARAWRGGPALQFQCLL
jgi:hypothetical protein